MSQRNAQIKRLETDIKTVKKLAEKSSKSVRSEASSQLASSKTTHEEKRDLLQESITTHGKQLQETATSNRESELEMRKVSTTYRSTDLSNGVWTSMTDRSAIIMTYQNESISHS